jgi:hypothetical protein
MALRAAIVATAGNRAGIAPTCALPQIIIHEEVLANDLVKVPSIDICQQPIKSR